MYMYVRRDGGLLYDGNVTVSRIGETGSERIG
jgi:hypothetical protein